MDVCCKLQCSRRLKARQSKKCSVLAMEAVAGGRAHTAVLQPDARWVNTGGPTGSEQRGCNNCAGDRNGRESDLMERWPFAEFLLFESHPSSDSSQVLNEEHRRLQSNNHDLQAAMIDWLCA